VEVLDVTCVMLARILGTDDFPVFKRKSAIEK
jgi:hypothetical protein